MACDSVAPSYSFKTIESTSSWPVTPGPPKDIFPTTSGDNPLRKIISFSCNLGLGDQSSTLSIEMSGFHGNAEELIGKVAVFK
jgi:hypothetical protein